MAQQTAVMQLIKFILVERRQEDGSIKFHAHEDFSRFLQMEKDQLKQEFIQGYNLGYEDAKCNHINDGETLAQEREYLKESTCEYSGLRSVQSYEDTKK